MFTVPGRIFAVVVLGLLAACAKPVPLPETIVHAASAEDFTRFRADLGNRFPSDQLEDLDTATRELQLDAMNREIASVAAREADMRRVAHGHTVHAVTLLGWQARRARFQREIATLNRMLERDLEQAARSTAANVLEAITRRIGSEREVIAKLQLNLAETERRIAGFKQAAP